MRNINGHGKHRLLAFDKNYRSDGSVNLEKINRSDANSLKEIYDYNPLPFDFVLKRTLRRPGSSKRFPASVFMTNPSLSV